MTDIIVGEKVINKLKETGSIIDFDDSYIYIDYKTRVGKLLCNAFETGFLKYENADLQNNVDDIIKQVKLEQERKTEELRIASEKEREERKRVISKQSIIESDINFISVSLRLDPAQITLNSVRKKDKELIQNIFNECDNDIITLYDSFNPNMEYPKYTSRSRSKYCVGFLCNYLNTYVFRVFSRNDTYKKRKTTGVTVMQSDTTEILRVLCIDGKIYYFSKNISFSDGYYNNSTSYNKWHISELGSSVLLNEIIKMCDCKYLNDYIAENDIECYQYVRLLMPALHNNKVEIVFKNKLFLSTYRIENIIAYLEEFTSKQIDFASKNNVINTLPIIKQYGIYDIDMLLNMETIMKKRNWHGSIYEKLKDKFKQLNFNCDDLGKRLLNFLKKVDYFNANVYGDYIDLLAKQPNVTIGDFFDKDYINRHDIMTLEESTYVSEQDREKYIQVAKELSWINRKENGFFIIVPKNISDFKYEGEIQHNCVYTNRYFSDVINHCSIIVFLRKEEDIPFVTIEFDYETFDVLQAYGKHNRKIDKSLYNYIVQLGRRLKCEMLSQ